MLKLKNVLLLCLFGAPYAAQTANAVDSSDCGACTAPISQNLWQPHAFSNYASREILILKGLDVDATEDCWLNRVGFATEYMQSLNSNNCTGLGAMPFWSGTNSMTIGNNDGKADLDAYQFGMGNVVTADDTGIAGTITLSPKVQHVGTEFLWYGMQNKDEVGAYFKVKVPLGAMMITSNVCETPIQEDQTPIQDYFTPPVLYFPSLSSALQGGTRMQSPLYSYGALACNTQTVIRFGDITAAVGANFVATEKGHFGVGAKFSCPTGNVPDANNMLQPIFGRAGHWGVGGEISGHYRHDMNQSCGADYLNVWFQGEIMHLFNGRTGLRSFDLKANGKGSKYLLLQHFRYTFTTDIATDYYSADVISPAINVTTLPVNSSFAVEGNFAVMLDYVRDDWNLSIGGDFWGRSAENLSISCCVPQSFGSDNQSYDYNLNNYAVIGRQLMNVGNEGQDINTNVWVQPSAKINESLDVFTGTTDAPEGLVNGALASNRLSANYNDTLDICGAAAQRIFTGKILGEIGYTWSECKNIPHVSVFGGAEFAASKNSWPNLWSAGIQASFQF